MVDECVLSERELEILSIVATGATNAQVAQESGISVNTVKVHLRNIYTKLEVESRTEATTVAISRGWIAVGEGDEGRVEVTEGETEPEAAIPVPTWPSWLRRERLPVWKRLFLLGVLVLASLAAFWNPTERAGIASYSDTFVDHEPGTRQGVSERAGTSRWQRVSPLTVPRARFAAVSIGADVYAIGGDSAGGVLDTVEVLDSTRNTWEARAPKPVPAANIGAVAVDGRIYVPGGYGADGEALALLEIYDPRQDQWTRGADLPQPLFGYAIAALGSKVYVFGGYDGQDYRATTYIYDTHLNSWEQGTLFDTPRGFLAAAIVEGHIYVVGGYDGTREYSRCQLYDPEAEGTEEGPWHDCEGMLTRRGGHGLIGLNGTLYAIGGGWNEYLYFNERYDTSTGVWSSFETPVMGQWRTVGVTAALQGDEQVIYALGGWNGEYLSQAERYRPFFYISLPSIP
jgi:DNA-binding CsgD family transcriptional regulator/N-acetylneuraminic acid mutarotase